MPDILRPGINKVGNACISGPVTTTGGNDLLHTMPTASTTNVTGGRSAIITKIMDYNNSGGKWW